MKRIICILLFLCLAGAGNVVYGQSVVQKVETEERLVLNSQNDPLSIVDSRAMFDFIDNRFYKLESDLSAKSGIVEVEIYELTKNSTLKEAFASIGPLNLLAITEDKVVEFVKKYSSHLNDEFGGNYFLIISKGSFYFVDVKIIDDNMLCFIFDPEDDFVWHGHFGSRLIVARTKY